MCMIETTTHNDELFNNDVDASLLTTQQTEHVRLENSELKEIEEKVKNIRFEPSKAVLDNILSYARH